MESQRIVILFVCLLFFSTLFIRVTLSNYIIPKNVLQEIEKNISKNDLKFSYSNINVKCYFDRICIVDKPIRGFEKYFLKDDKIFKLFRTESLSIVDAYRVWNISFEKLNLTGANIRIAIIDTGIDISHEDLDISNWKCFYSINNNIVENNWSYCNDTDGHGTHIAGIIAGKFNRNISKCFEGYPCGIAPNVTLLIAKVFEDGGAYFIDILNALEWAIENNASIISMSFGIDLSDFNLTSCYPLGSNNIERDIYSFSSLMDYIAKEYNVVLVAAAGNNPYSISTPACAKSVIAVGAIDKNKNLARFSSKGPIDERIKPDIVAPGVLINSTYPSNTYKLLSGTSMAAPFVSGAAALLIEALKVNSINFTSQDIKALILTSPNELTRNNSFGSGILNVTELIRIRNNFITLIPEKNETLRFRINKNDNYPFKMTIYRNEFFEDKVLVHLNVIKDGLIIFNFSSFDNVVQYKNESINGIFEIEVSINQINVTEEFSNVFTFVFSHKIANLEDILSENLSNFVHTLLNVTIESPVELKLTLLNRSVKILISDFAGIPIKADKINVSILNLSGKIVYSRIFNDQSLINFELPSNLNSSNYILCVIAEKGNRIGIAYVNFSFTSVEFLSPRNVLKLMNGDLLNITLKFGKNNINILDAYLYLENDKQINISLNFLNKNEIYYNISRINLSVPGKYILFLNISASNTNATIEVPIFEFSPNFNYNISYIENMFADKEYFINVSIFHLNGTKLNINKKICIENESGKIFCNETLSDEIRTLTNVTDAGNYNLTINVTDINGNYLFLNFSTRIEFLPNLILINIPNNKTTILKTLDISAQLYNSTKNSFCSFCKIFVNMTDSNKNQIFSSKEITEVRSWLIPKNLKPGIYNLTFFAKVNPLIVNSTQIEIRTMSISTNVTEKIFPNFSNVSINIYLNQIANISINITKINITGSFPLSPAEITIINGCNEYGIDTQNNVLLCNNTDNVVLSINSSETSTFLIEILAYSENVNGYLLDRFYSGFLIRPVVNLQRTSCNIEVQDRSIIINPYLKNYCFFDSRNQSDMSINRFEEIRFLAVAYAGATLDKSIPVNITINVTRNGTLTYFKVFNFSNLIDFNISNFTNLGKYDVNIFYTYESAEGIATKIENYEINVYDLNIHFLSYKNYTKVNGTIEVMARINRTNSIVNENVENIAYMNILTREASLVGYKFNKSTSLLNFSILFSKDFNGNVNIKIEDELGIENVMVLQNVTAYDYKLELSFSGLVAQDTALLGYPFTVKVSGRLLPFNVPILSNFSIAVENCKLIFSNEGVSGLEATFSINTTLIDYCSITINANATYLDMFFQKSEFREIKVIYLPQQERTLPSFPSVPNYSLLIRKISDEIIIRENSWNTTVIFITSIGANQNVFLYVLDYPQDLVQIIPRNQTIRANEELPFLLNISLLPNENRSEFEITLLFNSSFVKNETKIKIKVLKTQMLEIERENLKNEIQILEGEIKSLEEIVVKLRNESLLNKLLEARVLLTSTKNELERGNINKTKELINQIKEILNFVKDNIKKEERTQVQTFPIILIVLAVATSLVSVVFFLLQRFKIKRPYYDVKRKRFVWSKEDESVWQKLKEKWKRKA